MQRSTSSRSHAPLILAATIAALLSAPACVTDNVELDDVDQGSGIRDLQDQGSFGSDMRGDLSSGEPDEMGATDMFGQDMGSTSDMNQRDMFVADMPAADDQGADLDQSMEDAPADLAPSPDMQDMSNPLSGCPGQLVTNKSFALHPSGFEGQLYSRSAFDGEGVWVVYAMREAPEVGTPDIWATRIACDGTALVPPIEIGNLASGIQEAHPAIAVRGKHVYMAWIEDTSSQDRVMMRSFAIDGTPLQTVPVDITPQQGGVAISGLFNELDLAALPGDEAAIAVSHYSTPASAFQVSIQRVDSMGNLLGMPMEPIEEKGVSQTRPSITALTDGTIYVSWSRYKPADTNAGTPEEPNRVVYTRFAPGASEAESGGPFPAQPGSSTDNQLSRYSKELTSNDRVFLTFQSDSTGSNDILIKDGSFGANLTSGFVGNSGYDLRPSVASRRDGLGGAVTWYRANPNPTQNEVHIQRFDLTASGAFQFGPDVKITTANPAHAPFGPSITYISQNTYFVTWQEGASASRAVVMGRFVDL